MRKNNEKQTKDEKKNKKKRKGREIERKTKGRVLIGNLYSK